MTMLFGVLAASAFFPHGRKEAAEALGHRAHQPSQSAAQLLSAGAMDEPPGDGRSHRCGAALLRRDPPRRRNGSAPWRWGDPLKLSEDVVPSPNPECPERAWRLRNLFSSRRGDVRTGRP